MKSIDPLRVSTQDLASILGLTPETIRLRKNDGTLRDLGQGKYDLAVSVQAYIDYVVRGRAAESVASAKSITERERARKLKLENDRAVKDLLETEEVRSVFAETLVRLRQHVGAIGARLSGKLAGTSDETEIRQAVNEETTKALEDCFAGLQELAGLSRPDEVDPSAQEPSPF